MKITHLVLALMLSVATAAVSAAPSIIDALPTETAFVVSTPNRSELRENFERTGIYALWQEPSIQLVFQPALDMLDAFFADQSGQSTLREGEFQELFPGQIAVGIMDLRIIDGMPDIAPFFAAETQRPQRVMEIIDNMLESTATQQQRDTYTVQDVTVQRNIVSLPEESAVSGSMGETDPNQSHSDTFTLHTAVVDGVFMVAIDESLETFINNVRGGGDGGLTASDAYQSAAGLVDSTESDFTFFLRPGALDAAIQALPAPPGVNLAALGLSDVRGVASWSDYAPEAVISRSAVSVSPNSRGIGRLINNTGALNLDHLNLVPRDVLNFSTFGYDVAEGIDNLKQVIFATFPEAGTGYPGMLEQFKADTGVDLEAQIFQTLGSTITTYNVEAPAAGDMMMAAPMTSAWIIDLTDAETLSQAFAQLAAPTLGGEMAFAEAKEYQGQTYYTPPSAFMMEGMDDMMPAFGVVGGKFIYTSSGTEMRNVIASSQAGLDATIRDNEAWGEIEAMMTENTAGISYQDDAKMMSMAAGMLQQMSFFLMMMDNPLPLNLMALPGDEVYEQHLSHTITVMEKTPNGLTGIGRTPN